LRLAPDHDVTTFTCDCGRLHERVTGFVNHETNGAVAIFYAECVHHEGQHEAYIDVVLDNNWDPDKPTRVIGDRFTFGCRYGYIENHGFACTLVTPGGGKRRDIFGTVLTREGALEHEWLPLFWDVVDLVLENDPTVRKHFGRDVE
jgi:hypothetical protein